MSTSSFGLIIGEYVIAALILRLSLRRPAGGRRSPGSPLRGVTSALLRIGSALHNTVRTGTFTDRSRGLLLCGGVAFAVSVAGALVRWPAPVLHDEFSNLLAADTFCEGRLTNPAHPFWQHFESMHILQQPTYASKYPPLQGLLLAIGQCLTGSPVAGLWLSSVAASVAITWMLQGWLPPRWALFGGMLAALHTGLQLRWGQTFMGGAPAVIGAALLIGAYGRWLKHGGAADSVIAAFGLVLLATSRPFEGLLVGLPIALSVICRLLIDERPNLLGRLRATIVPAAAVLAAAAAALMYYNIRVTGNPLTMPYSLHSRTYMSGTLFLPGPLPSPPPEYRHVVMKEFHSDWEIDSYRAQQSLRGFLRVKTHYYSICFFLLLSPVLSLGFVWGARGWLRQRRHGQLVLMSCLGLLILGSSAAVWVYSHYLSPALPIIILMATCGARQLWCLRTPGMPTQQGDLRPGRQALVLLSTFYVLSFLVALGSNAQLPRSGWQIDRERIIQELREQPGDDLIFVRYSRNHSPHDEWVYNRADLDGSSIVWAREMNEAENKKLRDYFHHRKSWLLNADVLPRQLIPL